MVACCLNDDDPQSAIDTCKRFLLKYLRQEPHVAEHSGIDHLLVERIRSQMSWTPTEAELQDALPLISNTTVQNLAACGSTSAVIEQIQRFLAAGSTSAVLCILGHQEETLRRLGRAAS